MSEYQYYEFLAVDRPLDEHQLGKLRALSTRARLTPASLVNTYHWGDFRGNPRELMEKYFDAFLYLANWGTHRLMIRLPARLLDLKTAALYCVGDAVAAWTRDDHVILDLVSEKEGGDWEEEDGEERLASIIPARAELAAGDLRVLYLAWLLSVQSGELDDDVTEPPVPPGLGTLTAPLQSLADFLRIDDDLLAVVAMASEPSTADDGSAVDLARWIENLPAAEKTALLVRIAHGDDAHLRIELLRRFRGEPATSETPAPNRTVAELLEATETRRAERERITAEQREQECARRAHEAAIARTKHLDSLAFREEQAWQRVSVLIDTKKPGEYDTAVELLVDLRAVGEQQGRSEAFEQRFEQLRQQHLRKPSLLQRLDRAGLGATSSHL